MARKVALALPFGILAALLTWGVGMFVYWQPYGFWLVGQHSYDGAQMTRLMMLYALVGTTGVKVMHSHD